MKKIYSLIAIFFFLLIAVACLEDDTSKIDSDTNPVLMVNSKTLYNAISDNEIAADEKYKRKITQATDFIMDTGKDLIADAYITLVGDEFFGDVKCFFPNKSELINLKKGKRVKVIGYCDGLFLNVLLKNCIIK